MIADLCVRSVWQPQTEGLFDICVIVTDAQSHVRHTVAAVFSLPERKLRGSTSRHAGHLLVDGSWYTEYSSAVKRVVSKLYMKWGTGRSDGKVMNWVQS